MNTLAIHSPVSAPDTPPLAKELAARAFEAVIAGHELVFDTPIPDVDPLDLMAWVPDEATYWNNPQGLHTLGFGSAAHLVASGRGRFHELGIAAEQFFERLDTSESATEARLIVGCAFHDSPAPSRLWEGFSSADATLPSVTVEQTAQGWVLRIAVTRHTVFPILAGQIRRVLRAMESLRRNPPPLATLRNRRAKAPFQTLVEDIRGRISRGEAEKIVAARRVELDLDQPLNDAQALRRLEDAYPDCRRFAFRRQGRTFLGATPEPLLERYGSRITTVALAGSAAGTPEGEALLRDSAKDAVEHQHVVDHLRSGLGPFCSRLDIDDTPHIRRLRGIVHLETAVDGELKRPAHILRLVAAIHPTPAVGGVPRQTALDWIADQEGADRGWYSGPVGWFSADGDGDFAVAIRSGLLDGHRASLWAGAGIVAASNAEQEEAETLHKLHPLMYAIGVEE